MKTHKIGPDRLTIEQLGKVLESGATLELSESAIHRIQHCRDFLDKKLSSSDKPIYGINTGFGALYNKSIAPEDRLQLQVNLVRSHACGAGERVREDIVKLMLLLKAQGLSYGHSGSQAVTVQRLVDFYNAGVLPLVFEQGSLGASGDLAPLAHLSLPLFGEGEVWVNGTVRPSRELLKAHNWNPIDLQAKEGLALLNGTQFMSAHAVYILYKAKYLSQMADCLAALSLDAFDGRIEPFTIPPNMLRSHPGQVETADTILRLLKGSELIEQEKEHVQDPYSFRCVPPVHGASKEAIAYCTQVVEREINSVTDNPSVFPEEDKIISAGNFHGQALAMSLDFLAIALAELGSISERRTYKLISGQRGLPPFLVAEPGLNSGFMIPQYTCAGIVSQNKQLCTPCVVDTIDSSQGQEDHVSMGANAATKCLKVVENLERILGIELYAAAQALDFRRPKKSSPALEKLYTGFREKVPFVQEDRLMYPDMDAARQFVSAFRGV